MPDIMMVLGIFPFSIDTAAYQKLTRRKSWDWQTQPLIGQRDAQQYMGPGEEVISLEGVVYPHYAGGPVQLAALRAIGDSGLPQLMVSGAGVPMGKWIVLSVEEEQGPFFERGAPRKQTFKMELKRYQEGLSFVSFL